MDPGGVPPAGDRQQVAAADQHPRVVRPLHPGVRRGPQALLRLLSQGRRQRLGADPPRQGMRARPRPAELGVGQPPARRFEGLRPCRRRRPPRGRVAAGPNPVQAAVPVPGWAARRRAVGPRRVVALPGRGRLRDLHPHVHRGYRVDGLRHREVVGGAELVGTSDADLFVDLTKLDARGRRLGLFESTTLRGR